MEGKCAFCGGELNETPRESKINRSTQLLFYCIECGMEYSTWDPYADNPRMGVPVWGDLTIDLSCFNKEKRVYLFEILQRKWFEIDKSPTQQCLSKKRVFEMDDKHRIDLDCPIGTYMELETLLKACLSDIDVSEIFTFIEHVRNQTSRV